MAKLKIEIDGDEAIITPALRAFALHHGWHEKTVDPETGEVIDNPETDLVFARLILREFMMKPVQEYNIRQAQAAIEAQVGEQVAAAMNTVTMTVEIVE